MLQKFEKIVKGLEYPYSEQIILATERRLNFIEHLLKLQSETLFQYFQIDHSDLNSRIKSIKCQLCVTGCWGQSKHGKNVDLNKLIQGICSYEQSLTFVYKLAKHLIPKTKTDTNIAILKDCLSVPHQLINTEFNPFDVSIPKEEEFKDVDNVEEELKDILEIQQSDIEKLSHVEGQEKVKLGYIPDEKLNEYEMELIETNKKLSKLKELDAFFKYIQSQNADYDERYLLKFPDDYNEVHQVYRKMNPLQPKSVMADQMTILIKYTRSLKDIIECEIKSRQLQLQQ